MGRGVSSGGGQSSLGYLFGGGEAPKSAGETAEPTQKPTPPPPPQVDGTIKKQIPAGIQGTLANNYYRADGQNTGNFITTYVSRIDHQQRCKLLLVAALP